MARILDDAVLPEYVDETESWPKRKPKLGANVSWRVPKGVP